MTATQQPVFISVGGAEVAVPYGEGHLPSSGEADSRPADDAINAALDAAISERISRRSE